MADDLLGIVSSEMGLASILYGLERVYDAGQQRFDYQLKARLPSCQDLIIIKLERGLGQTLAQYWAQNDNGTFIGRHNMLHIISHLTKGEDI